MKEIAGLKCTNAKILLARSARSHTIDYIDMGILPIACEVFIVPCHE